MTFDGVGVAVGLTASLAAVIVFIMVALRSRDRRGVWLRAQPPRSPEAIRRTRWLIAACFVSDVVIAGWLAWTHFRHGG